MLCMLVTSLSREQRGLLDGLFRLVWAGDRADGYGLKPTGGVCGNCVHVFQVPV